MLIWQGKGIVSALPFLLVFLPVLVILHEGAGMSSAVSAGLGLIGAGVVGAIGLWALDRWLEQRNPPRTLVDQRTGQQVVVKRRDTLFFIPMRFFPYAYGALAVAGVVGVLTG